MFSPRERVAVAVSGGADSVALLHCLRELAPGLGIELEVVHLNHCLRGSESDGDERFVADLAKRLDLRYLSLRVDAEAEARRAAENLEQACRRLRYQWFTELIVQGRSAKIATGHTRSDQAETVLFRLLRGAGSAGLAGIRPVVAPGIVRPLLEVSREDVLAYLQRNGWNWREDSTNQQTEFVRNRIRHELLPSLSRQWNPKLPESLAQLAEWAQAEENYWSEVVADLAERHIQTAGYTATQTDGRKEERGVEIQATTLAGFPEAVQRRLLRAAVERVRGTLSGIDYGHVEALRRLAGSARGGGQLHLPGLHARRSFGRLRLSRPPGEADFEPPLDAVHLKPPGTFRVPGSNCELRMTLRDRDQPFSGWANKEQGYNGKRQQALDWERLPKPLLLRGWQPGDRYQPWGRERPKKLKSLFQEGRIAAWDRSGWPVITASLTQSPRGVLPRVPIGGRPAEVVVWAHEFGPAQQYTADPDSRTVLEITARWPERGKNLEI